MGQKILCQFESLYFQKLLLSMNGIMAYTHIIQTNIYMYIIQTKIKYNPILVQMEHGTFKDPTTPQHHLILHP